MCPSFGGDDGWDGALNPCGCLREPICRFVPVNPLVGPDFHEFDGKAQGDEVQEELLEMLLHFPVRFTHGFSGDGVEGVSRVGANKNRIEVILKSCCRIFDIRLTSRNFRS